MKQQIILASTSRYRAELLARFPIKFRCVAPKIVESERDGERPEQMARRLAAEKARSVASRFPEALVIGSDQVAANGQEILRKPGTVERACAQLEKLRGGEHQLLTAVHVIDGVTSRETAFLNRTRLFIRSNLTSDQIAAYVRAEQPLNCAGAYKIEGRGIALFEKIICDDWTAIMGLPLMILAGVLREYNIELIGDA